jgi:hypothetical protein
MSTPSHPQDRDDQHDQDAEPPTADGNEPDPATIDPEDTTPASDPDPEPGTA